MFGGSERRQVDMNFWLNAVFRPVVVSTMVTCVLVALMIMLARVHPVSYAYAIVLGGWLSAFLGIQSERTLYLRLPGTVNRSGFRGSEVVLILLVWRLVGFVSDPSPLRAGLPFLLANPDWLFDGRFYFGGAMLLLTWATAASITGDLLEIEVRPGELTPMLSSADERHYAGLRSTDRRLALERLARIFLLGGVVLAVAISLAAVDTGGQRLTPELAVLLLAYFGLGLVVLSQARLAVLQARWRLDGIAVASGLGRRWAALGLGLVGLLALVSVFLPTSFTTDLLAVLQWAVIALAEVVVFVISFLLFLVIALVYAIFGNSQPQKPLPAAPAQLPPLVPPQTGSLLNWQWLEILRLALFWVALVLLIIVGLRTYLRDRPEALAGLRRLRLWRWLRDLLRGGTRWAARIRPRRRPRGMTGPVVADEGWRWPSLRLRQLSPRELARYYYLSLIGRAARRGWVRHPGQTPFEYSAGLKAHLRGQAQTGFASAGNDPSELWQAEQEVDRLTKAFVEARYSERPFEPQEVGLLRRVWERLRRRIHA